MKPFYHSGKTMDMYFQFENEGEKFTMPLGAQSFGFFYPEPGFDFLIDMSEREPELIKFVKIITQYGIQYTVEDFLTLFEGEESLQIRRKT